MLLVQISTSSTTAVMVRAEWIWSPICCADPDVAGALCERHHAVLCPSFEAAGNHKKCNDHCIDISTCQKLRKPLRRLPALI